MTKPLDMALNRKKLAIAKTLYGETPQQPKIENESPKTLIFNNPPLPNNFKILNVTIEILDEK